MTALYGVGSAVAVACMLLASASAEDKIDQLNRQYPVNMVNRHGYSDLTDPLGRFLDLLAAGAFDEAKALEPDACATWAATRQTSAFSGKFWIANTLINLDTLCATK
jgi:hypothetical protein